MLSAARLPSAVLIRLLRADVGLTLPPTLRLLASFGPRYGPRSLLTDSQRPYSSPPILTSAFLPALLALLCHFLHPACLSSSFAACLRHARRSGMRTVCTEDDGHICLVASHR